MKNIFRKQIKLKYFRGYLNNLIIRGEISYCEISPLFFDIGGELSGI